MRFVGTSSREVLRQVREQLGDDAVILANRTVADGIEITAARGAMVDQLFGTSPTPPVPTASGGMAALAKVLANAPPRLERPRVVARGAAPVAATRPNPPAAARPSSAPPGGESLLDYVRRIETPRQEKPSLPPAAESSGMSVMLQELKAVRQAVETRLAEANIALLAGRHPLRLQLTADLLAAGFSTALVQRLMEKLPAEHGREAARAWFAEALVRNLRGAERVDPCVEEGGVYALVGPTGVGKTTTAAKLAARCVLQRGAEHVALISTDGYRVGAQEQLRAFAKILGVQARVARTAQELSQALVELSARHLVLIDTAGMGQRDRRVVEQNAMLAHCGGGLRSILLLAASAARETLDDVHAAYRGTALAGVALTKVDESVALGAALDVLLRAQLPLLYVANGQRVPEDLHLPNRAYLVSQALRGAPVPASPDGVAATLLARGGAGALAFA